MNYPLIADIASLIFLAAGALLALTAALGLVRFPDTLSRVHAISKPQTMGLILCIVGTFIKVTGSQEFSVAERGDVGILLLLVLFAMITSPVTAHRVSRVARREGLYGDPAAMSRNDAPSTRTTRPR